MLKPNPHLAATHVVQQHKHQPIYHSNFITQLDLLSFALAIARHFLLAIERDASTNTNTHDNNSKKTDRIAKQHTNLNQFPIKKRTATVFTY